MFKTLICSVPLFANHTVAAIAIRPESSGLMVWIGRCQVFVTVATVAFGVDHLISLVRGRNVATLAISSRMGTDQREATMVMNFLHF